MQKASGIAGSERHLLALLPALAAAGHDVRAVVLVAGGGGDLADGLRAAGVATATIAAGPHVNPAAAARLASHVRRTRPDVVHTHLVHADLYGQLAARAWSVAGVSSVHGVTGPYRREPGRSAAALAGHLAARTIAISEHVAGVVVARRLAPAGRVRVVPYGLDLARWCPPVPAEVAAARAAFGCGPGDVVVAVASRLVAGKGHDVLLDAFDRAAAAVSGLRLLVAGDGPLRDRLERRASASPAGGRVRFTGHLDDVRPLLAAADAVAFPTLPELGEGFGLAALEAMALGLPVLATGVGPLPELVVDGRTGAVVPPGDVGATAAALVQLGTDGARRRRLGRAGRARAEARFGLDRMVAGVLEVYEEALATRAAGAPGALAATEP